MIKIYGKEGCNKCVILCKILDNKKIKYNYIDIHEEENKDSYEMLYDLNIMTLPVVEKDSEITSDYNKIIKMFK